jgi:3-hydroxybutyryl-CoA dehydrogenase
MMSNPIQRIGIIGAGTMGQGIAQVCALAGYEVLLYDTQYEIISSGKASITKSLDASIEKNKITPEQKTKALSLISSVSDFRQLQVDLAIEAVSEKLEIKQKIFIELEKINAKDCLLLTNTSSISITQIGSVLKHQGRFAGLHFFNPAPVMKLVEIVKGVSTEDQTISSLKSFAESLGKVSVLAKDSPGFITNRVARHYYLEALKMLEEGVSDIETIDKLLKASGFKMGPFELMDFIGLDINLAVTQSVYQAFNQDSKFRPNYIQQQKVDAGILGRKSGKGFYNYEE